MKCSNTKGWQEEEVVDSERQELAKRGDKGRHDEVSTIHELCTPCTGKWYGRWNSTQAGGAGVQLAFPLFVSPVQQFWLKPHPPFASPNPWNT